MNKKKLIIIVGIGLVVAFIFATLTYERIRDFGIRIGKAIYEETLKDKDLEIMNQQKVIKAISDEAERNRKNFTDTINLTLQDHNNKMKLLESKSAKELRKINASLSVVLTEKEKDEQALIVANNTVNYLGTLSFCIIKAWKISDEQLDLSWQKKYDLMEDKYNICNKWQKQLEGELKRKSGFWPSVKKVAVPLTFFAAGLVLGG